MTRTSRKQDKLVNVSKIEKLMALMKKHKLDVIQAETESEKISLARNVGNMGFFQQRSGPAHTSNMTDYNPPVPASVPTEVKPLVTTPETPKIPDGTVIESPFVGTFYRSPGPDSPAFVDIGTMVKKGQTLCIVEAMKLMNEIVSDIDGKVVAILLENAKPVEFGTPLFVIAPN